ncbi:GGDEF domain-containing protein [Desulfonatronovibrio hydrogenovorans]|uniref:GGDEF domain-containing protein n=1 Tax=Desulfonatronovibrio hydrogenovorans TaxID=53245 RepID=UPI0013790DE9|nr:GGDEF domain-containing protein [Desulfonatronovibrio hydrogenovorans]
MKNNISPLTYEQLNETLKRLGIGEHPEWLGVILFVRNLLARMDQVGEDQKFSLQQAVIRALEKKDFSGESLDRIIRMIQDSLVDRSRADLEKMKHELSTEKDFTTNLITQIQSLAGEFKDSVSRQSSELNEFGEKTISAIELKKDPAQITGYIKNTIERIVVQSRKEALNWEARARSLEKMAQYDNLLKNLHNRGFLDDYLTSAVQRCHAKEQPLSLLMIDVDHFKKINDVWGHVIGDDVLKALAKLVRIHSDAGGGIPCRYGGEELCVIFEGSDEELAGVRAEELRKDVARYNFVPRDKSGSLGEAIHFTISIGVARLMPGQDPGGLISAADKAMYRAKELGRNKVFMYSRI